MPIKLNGSTSGYTQVQAPATAPNNTLTLPSGNGNLIADDGNGNLSLTGNFGTGSGSVNTVSSGIAINNATAGNYPGLEIQTAGVTRMYFNANNAASYISSVGTSPLSIYTNGSERMRIDSSGNVGIGASSPTASLSIVKQTTALSGTGNAYGLYAYPTSSGLVYIEAITGATGNTQLGFRTYNNGTYNDAARIDPNGYLLVGYTSSNGAYKLQVNSQIFATSSTVATSDQRYKENVVPLSGSLDLVSQLNPVQFSWKEHPVHKFDRTQPTVGFLAQEVQTVLADTPYVNSIVKSNICTIQEEIKDDEGNVITPAVTEEFLGIAEGNMIALLTKAIQELKAELDALKAQVGTQ